MEWKTGRKPTMRKKGEKIENGPRPEMGKKWRKNKKKTQIPSFRHFWAIFSPFPAVGHFLLFGHFFPCRLSVCFPFYTRRPNSQPGISCVFVYAFSLFPTRNENGSKKTHKELLDPNPIPAQSQAKMFMLTHVSWCFFSPQVWKHRLSPWFKIASFPDRVQNTSKPKIPQNYRRCKKNPLPRPRPVKKGRITEKIPKIEAGSGEGIFVYFLWFWGILGLEVFWNIK